MVLGRGDQETEGGKIGFECLQLLSGGGVRGPILLECLWF